jgi:hypothetical protein
MDQTYVEKRNDAYCISGTRVSLDSIVYAFRRGASPETIKSSFPALTLEQVYGANHVLPVQANGNRRVSSPVRRSI